MLDDRRQRLQVVDNAIGISEKSFGDKSGAERGRLDAAASNEFKTDHDNTALACITFLHELPLNHN